MSVRVLTSEQARGCGLGEGRNCCAFLTAGSIGFECQQRSELGAALYRRAKAGDMKAQRTPEDDFPSCQKEGRL